MADGTAGPHIIDVTPRWTEAALESLDPNEYDYQEYKGSLWMSREREVVGVFLHMLSKQVSAFANGAGGRLFIGIDDQGNIDGGVPVDLKGGGTRSWLEDVIPGLVSPSLRRFNVYEVQGSADGSAIEPGHAVYVIDISPSEDAPHQAHDRRYYLRIAGKSRPMGHIHIEDVLRRTRTPSVHLGRLSPFGQAERIEDDPRGPKALLSFRAFLVNDGRTLANHVGVEIIVPRPLILNEVRTRMLAGGKLTVTQEPGHLTFFRYHPTPVFPGQQLEVVQVWVGLHRGNLDFAQGKGAVVEWRVYADDAPAQQGSVPLSRYKAVRRAMGWVRRNGLAPSDGRPKRRRRKKGRSKATEPPTDPPSST